MTARGRLDGPSKPHGSGGLLYWAYPAPFRQEYAACRAGPRISARAFEKPPGPIALNAARYQRRGVGSTVSRLADARPKDQAGS
jgi:hypothetical protein